MIENTEMLDIVDEFDRVVGLEARDVVHRRGLLHREAHIWFLTPSREIVFQHRSKTKDTFPDKLDATVGGHVDSGQTYAEAAVRECQEEVGLPVSADDLIPIKKIRKNAMDTSTGMTNNVFRMQFAYLFEGGIKDLRVEPGESQGFQAWPINSLDHLLTSDRDKFIPQLLEAEMLDVYRQAEQLLFSF